MRNRLIAFLMLNCLSMQANADSQSSVLADYAMKLNCNRDVQTARRLLTEIQNLPAEGLGVPNEFPGKGQESQIQIATLDGLLYELYKTLQRFPELRQQVETIVLKWSYCLIRDQREFWDLRIDNSGTHLSTPARPFPRLKQGLGIWGFLTPDPPERYVPRLLSEIGVDRAGYDLFLHHIYVDHCFPHPVTGRLYDEEVPAPLSGAMHYHDSPVKAAPEYSIVWKGCSSETGSSAAKTTAQVEQIAKPQKQPTIIIPKILTTTIKPVQPVTVALAPEITAELPDRIKPAIKKVPIQQSPDMKVSVIEAPPTTSASSGYVPTPHTVANGYGISGNFVHNNALATQPSIGTNISWKHTDGWFLRCGVTYKYLLDTKNFGYSWGLGYDDWHPGTISFQINNWGPILPNSAFPAIYNSTVANVGYKFDLELLRQYHLASTTSFDFPLKGDPKANLTLQWEFYPKFFARIGLKHGVAKTDVFNWTYGFGYADSSPFTWGISYNNWGVNDAFTPNFVKNGAVAVSWGWAF